MRFFKVLLLASALALAHLALLKAALLTQTLPYLFWPSIVFRAMLLVLAAVPFAISNFCHLYLGSMPHPLLVYAAYYVVVFLLWPYLVALRKVALAPTQAGRRALLLGGSVVALGTAGMAKQNSELRILEFPLPVRDLPSDFEGLRIALAADLHRGPVVSQSTLEEVVEKLNSLKPDLIFMPGDFVSKSPRFFSDVNRAFKLLNPKIASFATLGNHDIWEGREKAMACLEGAGVITLQNRLLYLHTDGKLHSRAIPDCSICLAGVDDLWTGEPNLDFLETVPSNIPVLLLSHHPDVAEEFSDCGHRVDFQFSGHTHGGQIVFPGIGALATASSYGDKYLYGWNPGPKWPVFTTCGVGTSTVPVRVGTQSEIVLFTLTRTL